MSSLQRESKIYGAVESESYITFTGFCKRIYDTAQQSVDVFIDEEKVATLLANEKIRDIEEKYEVFDTNGFCFTYELPKKYIGQKHKLEFKTQEGKQLLHSPTHTIDKFSPLYNQAMFIESLHQPIQYHALENGYTKNALSFIAIEENLGDEAFIEFILEMSKKYKELSLSIVYFNEHQKNQATKIFNQIKNKNFINPSSVEEIIKNSEIYVHNVIEEFRFTINEEYYKKVKNIQAIKENLFMVELTRKAKKKKDMAEMVVDTVTPILFETSVVSQMFKEDERYNEFVFMNSLGRVDEEKVKNMYCPNGIGFLATSENLADEEFVRYINELAIKFPEIVLNIFYLKQSHLKIIENIFNFQNLELIFLTQISQVFQKISVFLLTGNESEMKLRTKISFFTSCIYLDFSIKYTIEQYEKLYKNYYELFFQNYELFKVSVSELEQSENSFFCIIFNKFFDNKQFCVKKSDLYISLYTKRIRLTLENKEFKEYFLQTNKTMNLLYEKNIYVK